MCVKYRDVIWRNVDIYLTLQTSERQKVNVQFKAMDRKELISIVGSEKIADSILSKSFIHHDFAKPVAKWKRTLVGAFISKYPKRASVLDMMCAAINKKYITWSDCTKINLIEISDYINSKVSANSATTYIHLIQALLNEFSEEKIIPVKSLKGTMRTKHVPSQHVALTQKEVAKFEAYVPKNVMEKDIKALFMRACYTGARCSDVEVMSTDNIVHGARGNMLNYVSEKTKVQVLCPVHRNLQKYLNYKVTKEYSAEQMKRVIQRICREVGIKDKVSLFVNGKNKSGEKWQFITMHSARRSFVSQLAAMGVPLSEIRLLAGHTSEQMTSRYVCLSAKHLGHAADAFFKG